VRVRAGLLVRGVESSSCHRAIAATDSLDGVRRVPVNFVSKPHRFGGGHVPSVDAR
jgi:hypothetical protein